MDEVCNMHVGVNNVIYSGSGSIVIIETLNEGRHLINVRYMQINVFYCQ